MRMSRVSMHARGSLFFNKNICAGGILNFMAIAKIEVLRKIVSSGLVAVIRAENPDQAARIADACALGGVSALEITFTVPGASGVIEHLAKERSGQILLGAGTVLDPETARIAILAGAQFVVSPALN